MTEQPSGIEAAALRLADKLERIIKQMERTGDWRLSGAETRTIMDASQFLAAVASRPAASGDLRERIARIIEERAYQIHVREHSHPPYEDNESDRWAMYRIKQELNTFADAILSALPGLDEEAIRADERERCAKVAEQFGKPYALNTNTGAMMFRAVTDKIAAAIRSLKTGSGE